MTLVSIGDRVVDRDRVLAELHPPVGKVVDESPHHPEQVRQRREWVAARLSPVERRRAELDARQRASLRAQVANADMFIGVMRAIGAPDSKATDAEVRAYKQQKREAAAAAKRRTA